MAIISRQSEILVDGRPGALVNRRRAVVEKLSVIASNLVDFDVGFELRSKTASGCWSGLRRTRLRP